MASQLHLKVALLAPLVFQMMNLVIGDYWLFISYISTSFSFLVDLAEFSATIAGAEFFSLLMFNVHTWILFKQWIGNKELVSSANSFIHNFSKMYSSRKNSPRLAKIFSISWLHYLSSSWVELCKSRTRFLFLSTSWSWKLGFMISWVGAGTKWELGYWGDIGTKERMGDFKMFVLWVTQALASSSC